MKVSVILKGKVNKYGMQPLQIRITNGKDRRFVPFDKKIRIAPVHWDVKLGQVKSSHPHYREINRKIVNTVFNYESGSYKEAEEVKEVSFFTYCEDCMNEWDPIKKDATLTQNRTEINKVKAFNPSFNISDLTPDWCKKYQAYCYSLGNCGNTVWKSFKFIRTIVLKAKREKLLKDNPFDIFPFPKYKNPKKVYLSKTDVEKINNLWNDLELTYNIRFAATWFVIACHTALRFGDLRTFDKKEHIKGKRLIVHTGKTGEIVSLPITDKIKGLLERIEYKPLKFTNKYYNELLKDVGKAAGVRESLSSHIARHTFGTLAADAGISQEVTAKLMGHSDLTTTAIYYQITNKRIDSEFDKMG